MTRWACLNAARLSPSLPPAAAGSGKPQWVRRKSLNTTGQVSAAAESHTVMTRSICGASGVVNSSQDLLRSPAVDTDACGRTGRPSSSSSGRGDLSPPRHAPILG